MKENGKNLLRDAWHDAMLLLGKTKREPSLIAHNITWCSNVPWFKRLEAYQQLTDWISVKHNNQP